MNEEDDEGVKEDVGTKDGDAILFVDGVACGVFAGVDCIDCFPFSFVN